MARSFPAFWAVTPAQYMLSGEPGGSVAIRRAAADQLHRILHGLEHVEERGQTAVSMAILGG
jgi:hypothetical protein